MAGLFAVGSGFTAAFGGVYGYLAAAGLAVVLFGFLGRSPGRGIPRRISVLIWLLAFAAVTPFYVNASVQALALLWGFGEWLRSDRRGSAVVYWALAIMLFWGMMLFHPNVPDLGTGLVGYRKTVLAVSGLILGCAIKKQHLRSAEFHVVASMASALAVSIVAFLWFPEVEGLVSRRAGEYTAMYDGRPRLQGVFPGPFHAAAGAVLLLAWSVTRYRVHRLAAMAVVMISLSTLYLTMIRTAFVASAATLALLPVLARSGGRLVQRTILVGFVGALVWYALRFGDTSLSETVGSIGEISTDSRFQNRLPGYREGFDLWQRSPIFGWGPGSAGDTLDPLFAGGEHVTAHNLVLKIAVEGGSVGLVLWGGLALAWIRSLRIATGQRQLAVLAIVGLLVFGITGSAIEALPVSFLIFLLAGLATNSPHSVAETQARTRVHL